MDTINKLFKLGDLGMGKSAAEEHIGREALYLVNKLKESYVGKPVDLNVTLNISTTNIIWAIVTGFYKLHFNC